MGKSYLIWIIGLLILPLAVAVGDIEEYRPNQIIPLNIHLTNISGDVVNATCFTQISNASFNVSVNIAMGEAGRGWYNATYNTSAIGYYPCFQNCTLGTAYISESCDFTIKGDNVALEIFLTVIFIIAYLFFFVLMFKSFTFDEHGAMKSGMFVLLMWLLLIPLSMAIIQNDFNGGAANISALLNVLYRTMIWINSALTLYLFMYVFLSIVEKLRVK